MNAQDERKGIVEQRGELLRRNLAQAAEKPWAPVLSPSTGSGSTSPKDQPGEFHSVSSV